MICETCADTGIIKMPPQYHGPDMCGSFAQWKKHAVAGPEYACPVCAVGLSEHASGRPYLPKIDFECRCDCCGARWEDY